MKPNSSKAIVQRAADLRIKLQSFAPNCSAEVISDIAVDLGDLIEVSRKHQDHILELMKIEQGAITRELEILLAEIEVNLLFEGMYHLRSLKAKLPKLVSAVYKESKKRKKEEKRKPSI